MLQTTLAPAQEAVTVALRRTLLLPLDDLLSAVREFLYQDASRLGLDRCLGRHGVGNLQPATPRPAHKPFKAYEPGYFHVNVNIGRNRGQSTRLGTNGLKLPHRHCVAQDGRQSTRRTTFLAASVTGQR